MVCHKIVTPEQITRVVDDILSLRPDYGPVLDLHKRVFITQEQSKNELRVEPKVIAEDLLKVKIEEQFPLITIAEFAIDVDAGGTLFRELCLVIREHGSDIGASAAVLARALGHGSIDFKALFKAFLEEDESFFEALAAKLGVDPSMLGFFAYNSVRPSLIICADQLSAYLDTNKEWTMGVCPICGSPPALSLFRENGKRYLCCSFCWHQWATQRIFCPGCENRDHQTIRYFSIEDQEEHRVDICDRCNSYIKTIDCRNTTRLIYPALEYIATTHLDEKMSEMGFTKGI
jgi:FdhE protein